MQCRKLLLLPSRPTLVDKIVCSYTPVGRTQPRVAAAVPAAAAVAAAAERTARRRPGSGVPAAAEAGRPAGPAAAAVPGSGAGPVARTAGTPAVLAGTTSQGTKHAHTEGEKTTQTRI